MPHEIGEHLRAYRARLLWMELRREDIALLEHGNKRRAVIAERNAGLARIESGVGGSCG